MKIKKTEAIQKQKAIEEKLKNASSSNIQNLYVEYKTTNEGISIVDVDDKLEEYGKNAIQLKNNNTILHNLKEAFINPFNMVLIIVAIVTLFTDIIIPAKKDFATFILIIFTLFVSAIISFTQQTKSDNAAKKLKNMITNKVDVIRDGVPCCRII